MDYLILIRRKYNRVEIALLPLMMPKLKTTVYNAKKNDNLT
tara:strand:+ start:276 stop:398 length:123 start_codon:yes stop_codon:yes gene_type:complete